MGTLATGIIARITVRISSLRPRDTLTMLARSVDPAGLLVGTRVLTYERSFGAAVSATSIRSL